jgi:transcriptional regulator with XRE-family HTH domain
MKKITLAEFFNDPACPIFAVGLATQVGMNPSLLSQYINGKKKPSAKQMERLTTGLHDLAKELKSIRIT